MKLAIIARDVFDGQQPLPRSLEGALQDRLSRSPVVVLTGARQTGRTTLARTFAGAAAREYRSLDAVANL